MSSKLKNEENSFDSHVRKLEEISLRKGISEKMSEKGSQLRQVSASISNLGNYTSCERGYGSKLREGKHDENAYRQLYF